MRSEVESRDSIYRAEIFSGKEGERGWGGGRFVFKELNYMIFLPSYKLENIFVSNIG